MRGKLMIEKGILKRNQDRLEVTNLLLTWLYILRNRYLELKFIIKVISL